MNIFYLHGYGSKFKPDSDKTLALKQLGTVYGINLNYGLGHVINIDTAIAACKDYDIDLIVGCSMGGWLASHTGSRLGLPFVALNPAIAPSASLKKYVGQVINYVGIDCEISEETVLSYPDFARDGCGLILCEEADEIIDARATITALEGSYSTHLIAGGSHRFDSLDQQLHLIDKLVYQSRLE